MLTLLEMQLNKLSEYQIWLRLIHAFSCYCYLRQGFVSLRAFMITNSALFFLDADNSWTRASISAKFEIMIACSITFLMIYGMMYFCWIFLVCANNFQVSPTARTAMNDGADNPALFTRWLRLNACVHFSQILYSIVAYPITFPAICGIM